MIPKKKEKENNRTEEIKWTPPQIAINGLWYQTNTCSFVRQILLSKFLVTPKYVGWISLEDYHAWIIGLDSS